VEFIDPQGGRLVGVAGQNAFLTGNVTGAVRSNAAFIITAKNLVDSVAGAVSGVSVAVGHRVRGVTSR
jgi:hypothetical protein